MGIRLEQGALEKPTLQRGPAVGLDHGADPRYDPREAQQPRDDQLGYGPGLADRLRDSVQGDPVGPRQQITPIAAATRLVVPAQARSAFCTVTLQVVRVTFDGTVPTANVGQQFAVGEHFTITGKASLLSCQVIEGVAGAALDVDYFD